MMPVRTRQDQPLTSAQRGIKIAGILVEGSIIVRISNYFVFLLVTSPLVWGFAARAEDTVNREIKRVYVNKTAQEKAAEQNYQPSTDEPLAVQKTRPSGPLPATDPAIIDVPAIQYGEAPGDVHSQVGYEKPVDPTRQFQEEQAAKQEAARQEQNYFKAVDSEFHLRTEADGIESKRDLANELNELKEKSLNAQ